MHTKSEDYKIPVNNILPYKSNLNTKYCEVVVQRVSTSNWGV